MRLTEKNGFLVPDPSKDWFLYEAERELLLSQLDQLPYLVMSVLENIAIRQQTRQQWVVRNVTTNTLAVHIDTTGGTLTAANGTLTPVALVEEKAKQLIAAHAELTTPTCGST